MSLWNKHAIFEKNSIILSIGILIVVAIGGLVEIGSAVLPEEHHRDRRRRAPLHAAGTGGPQHLRPRRLLSLPFADDPLPARRGRALWPLLAGGGVEVRPSVPVGLQAHRPRPRPHRRQIFRRLASRPSERPALGGPRVRSCRGTASWPSRRSITGTSRKTCACWGLKACPIRTDDIAKADADIKAQLEPRRHGGLGARQALSQGRRARRASAARRRRPNRTPLVAYLQMLGTTVDFKLYDEKANWR